MERAQAPFVAAGLDVPWFISRGNHDGLIQGNAPASTDLFRAIATGCLKVFPSAAFDPSVYQNKSADELFAAFGDPAFIAQLLASGRSVAPDPDRHIVSKVEYRSCMQRQAQARLRATRRAQLTASAGTASYYSWSPKRGLRFISLDTVGEGGGQNGNLDDPQYRWLKGELTAARKRHQLVWRSATTRSRRWTTPAPTRTPARASPRTSPAATATRAAHPDPPREKGKKTVARCSRPTRT